MSQVALFFIFSTGCTLNSGSGHEGLKTGLSVALPISTAWTPTITLKYGTLPKGAIWMIKKEIILLVIFLSVFGFLSGDILKDIQNKKTEKIMKNIESGKLDFNKAIDGHYPFLWAIMGDNHQLVRFMLDKGADLGVKTKGAGETALHIAAKQRNHKLIKALLEKGMAPNQQDRNGYTPLLTLCEMRTRGQDFVLAIMDTYYRTAEISKENLQLIIQNLGLQEESFDGNAYEQLLGLANPSAYLLLKHGADPNLGTQYRKPIIQARTKGQNPLLVLLLIEKGADLNDSLAQANQSPKSINR